MTYSSLIPFVLVMWHFVCDWLYQSQQEALTKGLDSKVRAWHCIKYAVPFAPLLWLFGMSPIKIVIAVTILFVSHFIIDSYLPVIWWAKYLRKVPEFNQNLSSDLPPDLQKLVIRASLKKNLKDMFQNPVGAILLITMDQFFHLCFLLPVMLLMVK